MTKQKSKAGKKPTVEIEIDPDAFERFRAAVHKLAKAGPRHKRATVVQPLSEQVRGTRALFR